MIFVAVVEGHSLVRAGLRMAIDAEPDLQVTVDCASAAELPKLLARSPADVVLLDYDVSGVGGSEAVGLITSMRDAAPVVAFTAVHDDATVRGAIGAGATAVLLKEASPDELLGALRAAASGAHSLSPGLLAAVFRIIANQRSPQALAIPIGLTTREREVLARIGLGKSNQEIAKELTVSSATVKSHVNRIFAKTGARDRTALVVLAYQTNLVS